ncbi:cytochrome o ubiquinol oxidase subunit IV [Paenibacillus sp. Soil787]|uniref:cytochrome o ubiquinol oxidase subunit IV n=1 Tax=Paenibacillus sp. Soil787 TaxID=1736411 RepID=UPI0007009B85|nr:cytochrome o ubiquinol oxidase subunit IV [Paenibacillus sp. Soil787]KRF41909.1 cytochrome o ubiquinol oxidase subunit IV [Paenibacillus sp. Soil787]
MGNITVKGVRHTSSLKTYATGFLLSIILTILPLVVVMYNLLESTATYIILIAAAILQFVVQLIFFMHLRDEEKPRYNLLALIFGLIILLTIIIGSIWIMKYNMVAH